MAHTFDTHCHLKNGVEYPHSLQVALQYHIYSSYHVGFNALNRQML